MKITGIPKHYNTETKWVIEFFCDPGSKGYSYATDLFNYLEMDNNPLSQIEEEIRDALGISENDQVKISLLPFDLYMSICNKVDFSAVAQCIYDLYISQGGDRNG